MIKETKTTYTTSKGVPFPNFEDARRSQIISDLTDILFGLTKGETLVAQDAAELFFDNFVKLRDIVQTRTMSEDKFLHTVIGYPAVLKRVLAQLSPNYQFVEDADQVLRVSNPDDPDTDQ